MMLGFFGMALGGLGGSVQDDAAVQARAAELRAMQEENFRREQLRKTRERERFLQDKKDAEGLLKGPAAQDGFELKDEPPPAPGRSIIKEAEELLRRCAAADYEASRALTGGS